MSTNQSSWSDSLQILHHQYGISVVVTQTFLLAKRPCGTKGLYSQASFWGEGKTGVSSEKPVRAKREPAVISTHILTAGFWTHATLLSFFSLPFRNGVISPIFSLLCNRWGGSHTKRAGSLRNSLKLVTILNLAINSTEYATTWEEVKRFRLKKG